MSNVAEVLVERPTLSLVPPLPVPSISEKAPQTQISREFIALAVILGLLQVTDGILTAVGVYYLGVDMEANPLLRLLMLTIGTVPTLIVVKSFAIGVIGLLTTLAGTVWWLIHAMRGMVALYMCAAIIPWSAILIGYFN